MAIDAAYFQWGGWALVALGGAVAAYGCFADRSRGRRRCPGCFYDLHAAPANEEGGWTCPECGRVATCEKQLHRTRPRRRLIVLGLVLALMSNALFAVPRIAAAGVVGAIPTTLLAPLTPWYGADFAGGWRLDLTVELKRRAADGEVHALAAYLWGWRSQLSLAISKGREPDMRCSTFDTERIAAACGMTGTVLENNNAIQQLVTSLVDPENWADNGGTRSQIFGVGRVMATETTARNDRAIRELLRAVVMPATGTQRWILAGDGLRALETVTKLRGSVVRPPGGEMSLVGIAAIIERESGLPVRVHQEEIEQATAYMEKPLDLGSVPRRADHLLDLAMLQMARGRTDLMDWCVSDGEIHVRSAGEARADRSVVIYDIDDLVEATVARAELGYRSQRGLESAPYEKELRVWQAERRIAARAEAAQLVGDILSESVMPDAWTCNGGDQIVSITLGYRVAIQAPAKAHAAIVELLAQLRAGPAPRMP